MINKNFKVVLDTSLIELVINNVYKGYVSLVSSLSSIHALNGDYVDVLETNTRWMLEEDVWVDTQEPILKIAYTKADVGLSEVDNTADINKPVSTFQQQAISERYIKPNEGIPKSDLDVNVKSSLSKADTALQEQDVIDSLSSEEIVKPLSANMGKMLLDIINNKPYAMSIENIEQLIIAFLGYGQAEKAIGTTVYLIQEGVPEIWVMSNAGLYHNYEYTTDDQFIDDLQNGVSIGYYILYPQESKRVPLENYYTKLQTESKFYDKLESENLFVPQTRTLAGKDLTNDISALEFRDALDLPMYNNSNLDKIGPATIVVDLSDFERGVFGSLSDPIIIDTNSSIEFINTVIPENYQRSFILYIKRTDDVVVTWNGIFGWANDEIPLLPENTVQKILIEVSSFDDPLIYYGTAGDYFDV